MEAGQKVGQYKFLEKLGQGAFGEVWKAEHVELGTLRAIKVPRSPDIAARLKEEGRIVAKLEALRHPNIVQIYDLNTSGTTPYVVYEYVEGEDLATRLRRGPMGVQEVIDLGVQVLSGLAAAHEQGIIHRDIKPSNILLAKDGTVKIADFGLGRAAEQESLNRSQSGGSQGQPVMQSQISQRLGEASEVVGTIAYMSPEQKRGEEVSDKSDVYSLGVVLYETLVCELPEGAFDPPGALRLDVPESLSLVVMGMLRPKPSDRPGTAVCLGGPCFERTPLVPSRRENASLKASGSGAPRSAPSANASLRAGRLQRVLAVTSVAVGVVAVYLQHGLMLCPGLLPVMGPICGDATIVAISGQVLWFAALHAQWPAPRWLVFATLPCLAAFTVAELGPPGDLPTAVMRNLMAGSLWGIGALVVALPAGQWGTWVEDPVNERANRRDVDSVASVAERLARVFRDTTRTIKVWAISSVLGAVALMLARAAILGAVADTTLTTSFALGGIGAAWGVLWFLALALHRKPRLRWTLYLLGASIPPCAVLAVVFQDWSCIVMGPAFAGIATIVSLPTFIRRAQWPA